ncbi:2-C-methyl-D-erythritol 4-phosphate cytidylyltransferase [Roseburia hominis]
MRKETCTAIVLAAGKGSRMGTKVHKQYLEMAGRPVLYYSLRTFQESAVIDEIILVTGEGEEAYCQENIVDKYGFTKVKKIIPGGAERYHSVHNGLQAMEEDGYVFIHDGARPFVSVEIIERVYEQVKLEKACVVGMPVKDTIKIADDSEYVSDTPDRSRLWLIQTPQVFEKALVKKAYEDLMKAGESKVTDDAMVVEMMAGHAVKLVRGSYENIKITTPEDLKIGELFASSIL